MPQVQLMKANAQRERLEVNVAIPSVTYIQSFQLTLCLRRSSW